MYDAYGTAMAYEGGVGVSRKKTRRHFGSIRRLPSGRYQVRYIGPDGRQHTARTPDGRSLTFDNQTYASAYLDGIRTDIQRFRWVDPEKSPVGGDITFGEYAAAWLAGRDLADRTRGDYAQVLRDHILPAFGSAPMGGISPADVRTWHASLKTGPTQRAHAYALLRTILATAVADDVIPSNPCRVRGGGQAKRVKRIRPATLPELETIATTVPDRYRLMVLLAAWCALRFGELAELRRSDIDVTNGVIRVRRGVVHVAGGPKVKGPKSEAGKRDVTIPPHLMPAVKAHLREEVPASRDALLFPAASGDTHMAPSSLFRVYSAAREKAGRPDLRFHDLRHTGATLAAATGATLAELMARLGHSTAGAALRYQHAAADRDKVIAEALSKLAGDVVPITAKASRQEAGG
jgi:integrase